MTAALITPPAAEPVTLAEAKAHLRITGSAEDDLLSTLVAAARIHVERATRLTLISQVWRLYLDRWPADGVLPLSVNPVSTLSAITVYGRDGSPSVLPATAYDVDLVSRPARVRLLDPAVATPGRSLNGIEIDLSAGFGPSGLDVPQPLRLAIMMLATRWYEARDGAFVGTMPADIADAFEALVGPYRIPRLS